MGVRSRAMEVGALVLVLLSLHLVVVAAEDLSAVVTPAFVWSDLRCLGEQDRRVNYEVQTPESLVDSVLTTIDSKCSAVPVVEGEEPYPEMVVVFIGKELRSEDISQGHSSGISKTLEEFVTRAKFSVSVPSVTVASDKTSVVESLLSHKSLSGDLKIRQVAVSGSCSVGRQDVKKLTDVPDILAYISGRKTSRAQGETDMLVICYSPSLDWNIAGMSNSEGEVLTELLTALKSSGTSNVAMYASDPWASTENNHYGTLKRQLLDRTGNPSPDCDIFCRRRAVILEGIFVVITLLIILVSGLCCMYAVKAPSRFEVSKEQ